MLEKLTIKRKILLLILVVITLTVSCYTMLSIYITEKAEKEGIDYLLYTVAYGAQNIVGDDYQDSIVDSTSVTTEEFNKKLEELSAFATKTNVQEIYSYIKYNGELRWTSGSLPNDPYFGKYKGKIEIVQKVYFKPFVENKPLTYNYEDSYGSVRTAFIPFTTKNGKRYVIAVDYSTEKIEQIKSMTVLIYVASGFVLLILAFFIAYIPINQISKPLKRLVKYTNEMVKNDFHLPENSLQNLYTFSNKSKDEIGKLSEAFLTMQFSLSQYIIDLRNTTIAKESIEGQLKIASAIQLGMIPKGYPTFPDREEFNICGYMSPAKEVGGDLFNYFMVDDDHLAFTIGDVSDKGIPAALFMAMTNTLIKAITLTGLSPADVLYKANNELCKENEQCMFVTLFLGILNIRTGEVEYANAGHNPFIFVQNDNVVEYRKMSPGIVLAAFSDVQFTNEQLILKPNETIFMYTDGVTEAMNHDHKLFGEDRLIDLIRKVGNLDVPSLLKETNKGVADFVDGNEQSDDITILALRLN